MDEEIANEQPNINKKILVGTLLCLFIWPFVLSNAISDRLRNLEAKVGLDPSPAVMALSENQKLKSDMGVLEQKIMSLTADYQELEEKHEELKILLTYHTLVDNVPDNKGSVNYDSKKYSLINTNYGAFAVYLAETKPSRNGVELTFGLINPSLYYFGDAELQVTVGEVVSNVKKVIYPKQNFLTVLVSPIDVDNIEDISLELKLNQIYYQ